MTAVNRACRRDEDCGREGSESRKERNEARPPHRQVKLLRFLRFATLLGTTFQLTGLVVTSDESGVSPSFLPGLSSVAPQICESAR